MKIQKQFQLINQIQVLVKFKLIFIHCLAALVLGRILAIIEGKDKTIIAKIIGDNTTWI
ncbi:hypothetical protein NW062_05845 [Mycoplasmopsis cynos]|nr:hypothetical protein NW062_05845 [Mycoplasmopsis cynos]